MTTLATQNTEKYELDLDFDDLTGQLDCIIDGNCHTIIDFEFHFEVENVLHDEGDYSTPESTTYNLTYNAYGFDGFKTNNDKSCEVSSEYKQIIDLLLEDEIKNHIDENELYKD